MQRGRAGTEVGVTEIKSTGSGMRRGKGDEALEMFDHGFRNYMTHAFPKVCDLGKAGERGQGPRGAPQDCDTHY